MVVALLLVVILAAVLVPPAVRAHAAHRDAFLGSFGPTPGDEPARPAPQVRSLPVQRRRQILGGLLIAMVGTGLAGLLPTFRVLLVVHLFLLDAFLGYVAVLARLADRRAKAAALELFPEPRGLDRGDPDRPHRPVRPSSRPGLRPELPPAVAAAG